MMKKTSILFLLATVAFAAVARMSTDLNFGWNYAPDGWKGKAHKVDIPHDFQMEMPWSKKAGGDRGFKPMGAAWYHNSFVTDPAWHNERVFLDFEGIMCVGDVWLNGKKVAASECGYIGFEVDITKHLKPVGSTNEVKVWVSTGRKRGARWYTGGGLYRPVHIKTRPWRAIARHGIFVSTPYVSAESAKVNIQLELSGFRAYTKKVEAVATVYDPSGKKVCETRKMAPCGDNRHRVIFSLPEISVIRPVLWDIDSPSLYSVNVSLVRDGQIIDSDSVRFGIRKIEFSKDFGFKLNGKKVVLKSMSNHSDYGSIGAAAFPRAIERELKLMKNFGYNAVRCSHNPYSDDFYRLCDELGLLVVDEFTDKWPNTEFLNMGRRPFLEIWPKLMTEWIRRNRNHPSIILWSLGNELQMDERFIGYDTDDWGITTYRMMDIFAKRLDPTRLTTVAMFPTRANAIRRTDPRFHDKPILPPELVSVTDIACFNYRYEDFGEYLKVNPNLIIFQSEASSSRWLEPLYNVDQTKFIGVSWWGAIEYWGESNRWPKKGWNYSFFSHALEPRPQAWLIRSGLLPDVPLSRIGVVMDSGERLVWNDVHSGQYRLAENWQPDGRPNRDVFVFSNSDAVELFLNGKSLGKKQTKFNVAKWEGIRFSQGRIEAKGSNGSSHFVETAGKAVRLQLVDETPNDWHADGMDLKYIKMYALDESGRRVPDVSPMVNVTVDGPATLMALDDDDHYTDGFFNVDQKRMNKGFLMAVLRAGRNAGVVSLNVKSEGLPEASIVLKTTRKNDNR